MIDLEERQEKVDCLSRSKAGKTSFVFLYRDVYKLHKLSIR